MKYNTWFDEENQIIYGENQIVRPAKKYLGKLTIKTIDRIKEVLNFNTLTLYELKEILRKYPKCKNVGGIFVAGDDPSLDEQNRVKEACRILREMSNDEENIKIKLEDKMLVWAWHNYEKGDCTRLVGFYDAENGTLFADDGKRNDCEYDNYKPFKGNWPKWAKKAYKTLKD